MVRFGTWYSEQVLSPGLGQTRGWRLVFAAAAAAVTVVGLIQRHALLPPGVEVLVALGTLSPWLVELVADRDLPRPLFVGVVIAGTNVLLWDAPHDDLLPFLLVILANQIGCTGSFRMTVGVVVGASVVLAVGASVSPGAYGDQGWWLWIPGFLAGAVVGYAGQVQMRLLEQERATRAALAQKLATEERQRVAREVHDVVAHSLGVTMLHLTAARHALESDADVAEAVDALREAERVGRQAMGDIRRTVGLLDGASPGSRPLPGLEDLPALCDEFRAAGIAVGYERRGEPLGLSPAAELDLYRVAEESLTNVAKHAPGVRVRLALDACADRIELRVANPLPATPPTGPFHGDGNGGRGIRGMRQRVELLGGALHAGPDGDEWSVVASIPATAGRETDAASRA